MLNARATAPTIQALAARTADYLIGECAAVRESTARFHPKPPMHYDRSPPGTAGRGVPGSRARRRASRSAWAAWAPAETNNEGL